MSKKEEGKGSIIKRRNFLTKIGLASAVTLTGCISNNQQNNQNSSNSLSGSINISGSSTVYPVSTAMSELFEQEHSGVDFSISRDGTSAGFQNAFIPGRSDVNGASRPIQDSERQRCIDNGFEPIEFQIARDALTIIVNNQNDWIEENCISLDTLREIWSPDTKPETWQDVNPNWPDKKFQLYGAATTSGTFDYFTEHIVGQEDKIRQDFEGTEQDDLIARGVEGSLYSLGYLPFSYYTNNPDSTKALSIQSKNNCIQPSLENAQDGSYPLARPLFIYVNSQKLQEKQHLQEFIKFYINNSKDQELIGETIGYVPASQQTVNENINKLNEYI